jgi:hypothetical protein
MLLIKENQAQSLFEYFIEFQTNNRRQKNQEIKMKDKLARRELCLWGEPREVCGRARRSKSRSKSTTDGLAILQHRLPPTAETKQNYEKSAELQAQGIPKQIK